MSDFTATYSAEDNKLRLYAAHRLDAETYEKVREAGFKWAPKQELFVAPRWTPSREDLLVELAGDIEPEGLTMADRAALKAERLEAIAQNKARKASAYARAASGYLEGIPTGQPVLMGHHSQRRHEKALEKADRARENAVKNERAIDYWLYRAESVQHHANYKNSDRTRANRIKTLLAELREWQRALNHEALCVKLWTRCTEDSDIVRWVQSGVIRTGRLTDKDAYNDLQDGKATPQEIRTRNLERSRRNLESPRLRRWIEHTLNRLAYERALLGDVARYDGEVTPVILQTFARTQGADKPKATKGDADSLILESGLPLPAHIVGTDESRLTLELSSDEWRDLMQSAGYEVPAKKKRRTNPNRVPAVPLVNPTEEEAARLQALWNDDGRRVAARYSHCNSEDWTANVRDMSQAVYSRNSGTDYAPCKTIEIDARGRRVWTHWRSFKEEKTAEPVARIRIGPGSSQVKGAVSVVRITDKPAKALPIDWEAAAAPVSEIELDKAS
jgi:hypothetical protein